MARPISRGDKWFLGVLISTYGVASVFFAAMAACKFGAASVICVAIRDCFLAAGGVIALLGPPVNLAYGLSVLWLWLYLVETLVFFSMLILFMRATEIYSRFYLGVVIIMYWFISGCIPFAVAW